MSGEKKVTIHNQGKGYHFTDSTKVNANLVKENEELKQRLDEAVEALELCNGTIQWLIENACVNQNLLEHLHNACMNSLEQSELVINKNKKDGTNKRK